MRWIPTQDPALLSAIWAKYYHRATREAIYSDRVNCQIQTIWGRGTESAGVLTFVISMRKGEFAWHYRREI